MQADASGRFAGIAALDEAQLLGATTADLPWLNATEQVDIAFIAFLTKTLKNDQCVIDN